MWECAGIKTKQIASEHSTKNLNKCNIIHFFVVVECIRVSCTNRQQPWMRFYMFDAYELHLASTWPLPRTHPFYIRRKHSNQIGQPPFFHMHLSHSTKHRLTETTCIFPCFHVVHTCMRVCMCCLAFISLDAVSVALLVQCVLIRSN